MAGKTTRRFSAKEAGRSNLSAIFKKVGPERFHIAADGNGRAERDAEDPGANLRSVEVQDFRYFPRGVAGSRSAAPAN